MDDTRMDRARSAQERLEREIAGRPGVLGVGIGKGRDAASLAFRVYVKNKTISKMLPRDFEGFEVIPEVTGPIKAY